MPSHTLHESGVEKSEDVRRYGHPTVANFQPYWGRSCASSVVHNPAVGTNQSRSWSRQGSRFNQAPAFCGAQNPHGISPKPAQLYGLAIWHSIFRVSEDRRNSVYCNGMQA